MQRQRVERVGSSGWLVAVDLDTALIEGLREPESQEGPVRVLRHDRATGVRGDRGTALRALARDRAPTVLGGLRRVDDAGDCLALRQRRRWYLAVTPAEHGTPTALTSDAGHTTNPGGVARLA